jgi:hypothetical protein
MLDMDDRSRKLLSHQALPKAKLPEPKAHERREFKLPTGVTPRPVMRASSASLEALRAKALDEGVKLAEGSKGNVRLPGVPPAPAPSAPGQQVAALGDLKWPSIGTPPPPFPEPAAASGSAPSPSAAGKLIRRAPSASVPPPAPPIPRPVLHLTKKKTAAPAPAPAKLPVPAPAVPAPVATRPPVLVDYDEKTPAPRPLPPSAGGKGRHQPALIVAEGAPSFREATTMWFRAGEEQAARAVRDAEVDAMERAEEAFLAGRSRGKLLLLAVVAVAAVLLLVLFLK